MLNIRPVTVDEASVLWELRLEALGTSPEAFGSSYEDALETPLEAVRAKVEATENQFILGAYADGEMVGMAGFLRQTARKTRHKGFIWGVYVKSDYRKHGVGKGLLEAVIEQARRMEGLELIQLTVVTANRGARQLYESLGFQSYGLERNALIVDGIRYDEELMVYELLSEKGSQP
ncbi:GNAT family N-acetyltransferase [Paenibacillus paeoniae]|uniref:GNAT family N-acetyltransferase n=1 Tax=Paenibacillus paeoniae TaxID=2292705 RepID=A0A371PLC3_9BACL|nr:GNAT family N-acetyltransferase [Paenibacillus paeoniae]REK77010.1 GNAT family N-acetyltransferase [Paenibacillus paeoniae]